MRCRVRPPLWGSLVSILVLLPSLTTAAPPIVLTEPAARSATATASPTTATPTPTKVVDPMETLKYFHEPGRDDYLGHYDVRYFHGRVTEEERGETLKHMMRAYLLAFNEMGLETWIAHGTLLGWWWNGQILPWDWDIDTQVSGATLLYMADNLNRTRYEYVSEDGEFTRAYLLDVNPHARQRERGDGANIIDARWIDTHNGLYVDITGLSELEPDREPGVVSCKNFHKYRTTDLYPMRASIFENVPVRIPFAYNKILIEEYETTALVLNEFEGHRWDTQQRLWYRIPKDMKAEKEDKPDEKPGQNYA